MQNHHDRVVAGNGAQYGGTFAVVDVISHAAGIAGPGADDGNVLGEMEGNEAAGHQHFACALVVAALVHDVVGKNIYIFPVHVGRFGYFQLFQVA